MNDHTKTVRIMLNELKFDWSTGRIIYQETAGVEPAYAFDFSEITSVKFLDHTDPILDMDFNPSAGHAACPRIFARDKFFVYFPSEYDGATKLNKICIIPEHYRKNLTPYI